MKRALAVVAVLVSIPAFADWKSVIDRFVATQDGYSKVMASWMGSTSDQLVASWGPPQETTTMANGHILYIYRATTDHQVDGQVTKTRDGAGGYTKTISPPSSYTTYCTAQYEIAKNRIVSWHWEGQDCRSTYNEPEPPPQPVVTTPPPPPVTAVRPTTPAPPVVAKSTAPWLGIEMGDVTPDVAERLAIEPPRGVLVINVLPSSPAHTAGLSILDVIATIDGKDVHDPADVQKLIGERRVGDMVMLGVVRRSKVETVSATLTPHPG